MPGDRRDEIRHRGQEVGPREAHTDVPTCGAAREQQARPRGRGRRAGSAGSREAVLDAARKEFAQRSFEQVTVRAIGKRAGVDAAMVNHWFGGKDGLFAAAAELPVRAEDVVPHVVPGPRERVGGRLLQTFLAIADRYPAQLAILVRNMHSNELAGLRLRSLVDHVVLRPVIVALDADEPRLRTALCSLQLIGLAVARFAPRPNGVVELPVDDLIAAMAPTLQRYLVGTVRFSDG